MYYACLRRLGLCKLTMKDSDALVFTKTLDDLLASVRSCGRGEAIDAESEYLLERLGFVSKGKLTSRGKTLDRLVWILRKYDDGERQLAQAMRVLLPMQVIEQELHGFGAVDEEGVMELLQRHNVAPEGFKMETLRNTLRWMSKHGLIAYSPRYKTVRVIQQDEDAPSAGEDRQLPALISPRTPYSNLVRLRRTLRTLRGTVWWADPHFGARALEELAEELDTAAVKELRILSREAAGNPKAKKDFDKFAQEMAAKGIRCEWRVDAQHDWHDRWLADDKLTTNMPPVNTLFKGDYSEMLPASQRPPLEDWWKRSQPL